MTDEYMQLMAKLKHYEDLEEQGRLITLPCALGDIVYEVNWYYDCRQNYECKGFNTSGEEACVCCEREYKVYYIKGKNFTLKMLSKIGINIFLTREEADKKIEELRK